MGEIPGIIRPELQALPQIKDRMTFHDEKPLFPACAGVIPDAERRVARGCPFPRVCGGDPWPAVMEYAESIFSPRVRG